VRHGWHPRFAVIRGSRCQRQAVGASEILGPVLVDHMDYGTLDPDFLDYTRAALTSNIGSFPVETHATFQTLAVISAVNADLAA
jgi:hypothetical protein